MSPASFESATRTSDENLTSEEKERLETEVKMFKNSIPSLVGELLESPDKEKREFGELLASYCMDQGVGRDTSTALWMGKEFVTDEEKAHVAAGRTSFISRLEEIIDENPDADVEVVLLDIADFGLANRIETTQTSRDKPADVVISRFHARLAQKAHELGIDGFVRYGGDEAGILLNGRFSEKEKTELLDELIKHLEEIDTYTLENGKPARGKLKIKDKFDRIVVPKNDPERGVFLARAKKGVLLPEKELKEEMERLSPKIQPLIEEKVKEEALVFDYTPFEELITKGVDKMKIPRERMEKFVRENLIDRLLGDSVQGITALAEAQMGEQPFEKVMSFDLSVKEMNDYISMTVADDGIAAMYEAAVQRVGKENIKNLSVFRKGGTLFVAAKKGYEHLLDTGELEKLESIKVPNTEITLPIGVAEYKNERDPERGKFEKWEVRTLINEMLEEGNRRWVRDLLLENPSALDMAQNPLNPEEITTLKNMIDIENFEEQFFWLYIQGKRFETRAGLVGGVIGEILTTPDVDEKTKEKLRVARNNLEDIIAKQRAQARAQAQVA
jgi:GGDEF domain-containing protein